MSAITDGLGLQDDIDRKLHQAEAIVSFLGNANRASIDLTDNAASHAAWAASDLIIEARQLVTKLGMLMREEILKGEAIHSPD